MRHQQYVFFLCYIVLFLLVNTTAQEQCTSPTDPKCAPETTTTFKSSSFVSKLLGTTSVGVNGVPIIYITDMLSFLRTNFSWVNGFCNGSAFDCPDKENFPGPTSYNFLSNHGVRKQISLMAEKEYSGEWWRGNELGTLINNPFFYYGNNETVINPLSIGLGITPKQHMAIRPAIKYAFQIKPDRVDQVTAYIEETVEQLLKERKHEGVLSRLHLTNWFHQVINKIVFNRHVSLEYCNRFAEIQSGTLRNQLISQILPSFLYGRSPLKLFKVKEGVLEFVQEYKTLLKEQGYEEMFLKGQDCSPSASCLDQLAYGIFDAFAAAGGASVSGSTFSGMLYILIFFYSPLSFSLTSLTVFNFLAMSVLFSTHESNPAGANGVTYTPDTALHHYWESVRIFPPVVAFPYWNPRPTCVGLTASETASLKNDPCPLGAVNARTGFPQVNQYQGGKRWLPNLAVGQTDAFVWGSDATSFRHRPLELYENFSVGFAEQAENPKIENGRMDRACPGRKLALIMGSSFLKLFHQDEWMVQSPEDLVIRTGAPYFREFDVYYKEKLNDVDLCKDKFCKCGEADGIVAKLRCQICATTKCPFKK